jgi:hypothetical protein
MLQNFQDWLKQPFSANMDTLHWFLFFLLIIVIATFWRLVLNHILEGVS